MYKSKSKRGNALGYGLSGPAPPDLHAVAVSSGTAAATSSYVPPTPFPYAPIPQSSGPATHSKNPSGPTSGVTRSGAQTSTSTAGAPSAAISRSSRMGLILGTTFGLLGFFVGTFLIVYYRRRRSAHYMGGGGPGHFFPMGGYYASVDDESYLQRDIPAAAAVDQRQQPGWLARKNTQVLNALGLSTAAARRRRDML